MRKANTSISSQIFSGYQKILFIIALLVITSLVYFAILFFEISNFSTNNDAKQQTTAAVAAHNKWLNDLQLSMRTGQEFGGSLDPAKCAFGKWMNSLDIESVADEELKNLLTAVVSPHELIHNTAKEALELNKSSQDAAYDIYLNEILPKANEVIDKLTIISDTYQQMIDKDTQILIRLILQAIVTSLILAVIAIFISVKIANRTAKKISEPIIAVAEWSKELSMGSDNLQMESSITGIAEDNEIGIMMSSFKQMAKSISDNVNVVKRVADGDMTAYVNIRSAEDSLGKNLYRMVQSNDLMFAEILKVAGNVNEQAREISATSQKLAENASEQANSVQSFAGTIEDASAIIAKTSEKAREAMKMSSEIKGEVSLSNQKMEELMNSMSEIESASNSVAGVIKSIEDIASQTNLLALNAAIEAARAGEAGKGFAVVAEEVRNLASESAKAAEESRMLIQDTLTKTKRGSDISVETSDSFNKISDSVSKIIIMNTEISTDNIEQKSNMDLISASIDGITQGITDNAAASEEAAAASEEMNSNADVLTDLVGKFNLRKREPGHAYIPPEKCNDEEFIKVANQNYQEALKRGKIDS